ncbi:ATP-binding protein [Pendulispora rubella]|uniref:ATP-binding protein n=1 Tax=Pendulispora rubella TaxID=2741070 RepID=UPI00374E0C0E
MGPPRTEFSQDGYNVIFARADETLRRLRQSRFDNSRDAEMTALTTVALLILDDFALEPMSKEESKDVYQLFWSAPVARP